MTGSWESFKHPFFYTSPERTSQGCTKGRTQLQQYFLRRHTNSSNNKPDRLTTHIAAQKATQTKQSASTDTFNRHCTSSTQSLDLCCNYFGPFVPHLSPSSPPTLWKYAVNSLEKWTLMQVCLKSHSSLQQLPYYIIPHITLLPSRDQ